MALETAHGRSLVDRVFQQLAAGIMSGSYPVGTHLPAERALAETLEVNRQVVREAIRRLSQIGLVQVLHGDGTRVLDFRQHGGLDVLALLMEQTGNRKSSLALWVPILELRSALAPDVIRHCALRAKLSLRRQILLTAQAMRRAEDDEEIYGLEQQFWDLVHEGANHIVYRLTYNAFKRCAQSTRAQSLAWTAAEVKHSDYRLPLAEAIAAGDADRAEREVRASMRAMLERAVAKKSRTSKPPPRAGKARAQSSLTAKPPPKKKASIL